MKLELQTLSIQKSCSLWCNFPSTLENCSFFTC